MVCVCVDSAEDRGGEQSSSTDMDVYSFRMQSREAAANGRAVNKASETYIVLFSRFVMVDIVLYIFPSISPISPVSPIYLIQDKKN